MKAIVVSKYGPPDVLKCEEVEKPTAGDDQVLIKVRAASVNPLDRMMRGKPYLIRLMTGLRRPKDTRLGRDVAGQVEAVGRNVTRFKPGDAVFGACRGALAEYACASESKLVVKPDKVTFEQAASAPVAGLTALQGLRHKGQIQPGQKVLINGAAGGVGTFAVQIAKSFGAEVTAVCSTGKVDMVLSIGADRIIDYTREDFTKGEQRYDLIFDCAATRSLSAIKRLLNSKGVYILVGAPAQGRWIGPLARVLKTLLVSWFVKEKLLLFLAQVRTEDLTLLGQLIEAGKVTPVIGKRYRLTEVPEAIRYLEEGHARGKVVVTM